MFGGRYTRYGCCPTTQNNYKLSEQNNHLTVTGYIYKKLPRFYDSNFQQVTPIFTKQLTSYLTYEFILPKKNIYYMISEEDVLPTVFALNKRCNVEKVDNPSLSSYNMFKISAVF